ncbi:hypothetical protein QQZ08_008886 [Neonectria magnoliae]|uniref:FAD-binding domain-containing protein n=1 Tax=Neonectria magnoliae TaxID=2732573 RepID=A0ABR1HSP3_9HYPO
MSEPTSLRIAIIGAGIGGLAAARVFREGNHQVTVYERNAEDAPEVGAAVGLGPNGSKMAKTLGLSRDILKPVVSSGFRSYDQHGTLLRESPMNCEKAFGSEWWMVHRQDLRAALLEAAVGRGPEIPGRPVEIVYQTAVDEVDAEHGIVTFADRSTTQVDLIIGADGVRSKARSAVVGLNQFDPVPVNLSLYRFTAPTAEVHQLLEAIPEPLSTEKGAFLLSFVADDGSNRNVVIYPCRNLEVLNFACAVPDTLLQQKSEQSWTMDGDLKEMLGHFKDFPPWLYAIMEKLDTVKLYQLRDADPIPSFVKGRVALIGDAAHPMVPYQGQGANQALEDAEGLRLFADAGASRDDVARILAKWDLLRRPRASQVQQYSRIAAAKVSPQVMMERMKFNWTYDGIGSVSDSESR